MSLGQEMTKKRSNRIMVTKRISDGRIDLLKICVSVCVQVCVQVCVHLFMSMRCSTVYRTSRAVTSSMPTEAVTCANTLAPSSSSLLTNLTRSAVLRDTKGDEAPPIPKGGQDRAHFLIMLI